MLELNFSPFPVIDTGRLTLRRLKEEDKDDLFILRSDKNIMQFIPRPLAQTSDDVAALIRMINEGTDRNETINWAMVDKANDTVIGTIGYVRMQPEDYRAEVGYMLHPGYQGKGIMQEALAAVLDYGFITLKLHSVLAVIDPGNTASEKLLIRNGFIKEGHFKENCFFEGKFLDSVYYSLHSKSYKTL
ncbi:GNAT family N-acetyltransferase [Chitinophagaceae bacterium MMS25-I14]